MAEQRYCAGGMVAYARMRSGKVSMQDSTLGPRPPQRRQTVNVYPHLRNKEMMPEFDGKDKEAVLAK